MAKNLSELFGKIDWDAYHNKDSKYVIDGTVYTLQKLVDIACDAILKSNTEQHTTADKYARDAYARLQMHKQNEAEAQQMHDELIASMCKNSTPVENSVDNVNHPAHYTSGSIEVIDFIEDQKLTYHLGNAVKYISRAGKKNSAKYIEDLEKAAWYLQRAIKIAKGVSDGSAINRPRVPNDFPPMPREYTKCASVGQPSIYPSTTRGNWRI